MAIVAVKNKYQVVIPLSVRNQVGVNVGDLLEAKVERGKITFTPKLVIDRSQFSNADDDYTAAQRKLIDTQLAKAMKGRTHGPFDSANEMIAHMKGELKKRAAKKTKRAR
ncbi:MAG: AbrB/MazE/SpoVT family DNA-binding domain-containing protein [Acidobacteriota bacterium]|nr:AbrB/MazE/SpoVT family DNA-binding domain-containing protein [Acidobacteriota bacterium]